jgi:hypothetical protein
LGDRSKNALAGKIGFVMASVARVGSAARQQNRSHVICFGAAKKYFCDVGLDLNDFLGQQSVSFAMDAGRRFCARRMGETKNFPATLVNPVLVVLNAVFPLRFHILRVSLCDIFRGSSLRKIMDVHA